VKKKRKTDTVVLKEEPLVVSFPRTPGLSVEGAGDILSRTGDLPHTLVFASIKGAFLAGKMEWEVTLLREVKGEDLMAGMQSTQNKKMRFLINLKDGSLLNEKNRKEENFFEDFPSFLPSGTKVQFELELSAERRRLRIGIEGVHELKPAFRIPQNHTFRPILGLKHQGQMAQIEIKE
jgi:hypothetical protein